MDNKTTREENLKPATHQSARLFFNLNCTKNNPALLFAEIILPIALPKTLTYGVPEELSEQVQEGIRVEVAFGKNKLYSGIIYRLHKQKPDNFLIKPIKKVLDAYPVVSTLQLQFWTWIADYYCCTLGDVMQAALPAHLKLMNNTVLVWSEAITGYPTGLSDEGYLVTEALQIRKRLTVDEIKLVTDGKNHAQAIAEVLDSGLAIIEDELKEKYSPKKEKYLTLNSTYIHDEKLLEPVFESLKKAPKQMQLALSFFQIRQKDKEVTITSLLKKSGVTTATLNALINKGVFEIYTKESSRLQPANFETKAPALVLNQEQEQAVISIKKGWQEKQVVMLLGVTGSGKTMVYIRLIQEQLNQGNQILFLLPEIALTTQIVQRLYHFFGDQLGVYHSHFSNNERVEIWKKVQNGTYKIILGARSALWLPFQDLKLIIVDEEQENSYKQQGPAPRFQARDTAIYLSGLWNAKVLVGSATPSLESAYNVQHKKYGHATIQKRYQNQPLPEITLIPASDTQPSLSGILTKPLLEAIQQTFSSGKQVLLFQNKRGYAPFLICAVCGFIPHCPNCDVSFTYHKATDKLHCHYCGQRSLPMKFCPKCGSHKLISKSFGTEKVEEDLQRIFPKRKIARMDTDSVRGKNRMNQLIKDFEQGKVDILVGTQMIVKGLDFENVGLAAILNADSLWSYPNFRVNERAFQLMEQLSGRAGRSKGAQGKVYIQAYNLNHPLLKWVKNHDYKGFYREEINFRKQFNYPPFCKLLRLVIRHQNQEKAAGAANYLAQQLQRSDSMAIQGPAPALVAKVRNNFLFEILVRLPKDAEIQKHKQQILQAIQNMQSIRGNSGVAVIADVDPS